MKLGHLLSKSQKKSIKSKTTHAPACNNTRARSINTEQTLPVPTGADYTQLLEHYSGWGLEDAAQSLYENQQKYSQYIHLSFDQCLSLVAQYFHEEKTTLPVSKWKPRKVVPHDETFHPHVHRKRYKGGSPSIGDYREDQVHQAEPVWRSEEARLKILGIAK